MWKRFVIGQAKAYTVSMWRVQLICHVSKITLYTRIWSRTEQNNLQHSHYALWNAISKVSDIYMCVCVILLVPQKLGDTNLHEINIRWCQKLLQDIQRETCPLRSSVHQTACLMRWIPFWTVKRVIIPTKGWSDLLNPSLCCNASLAAFLPSTTFSGV